MTGIIDCDVHHEIVSSDSIFERLDKGWQDHLRSSGPGPAMGVVPDFMYANPNGNYRAELTKDDVPPGASIDLMRSELLEPLSITNAVLTHESGLYIGGFRNPYLAQALSRAYNDDMVERWLEGESRCYGSLTLPIQVPEFAAEEIRRLGDHEKVVAVVLAANGLGPAFGHPVYEPVHRAAAERGLAIAIHSLGEGTAGTRAPTLASSNGANFYLEYHAGAVQGIMTHLMSFITHGVFERFPDLKLVLLEGGVAWIPPFLRRLDNDFRALREEVPWCRRLPSEVFREHVRVATQPFEGASRQDPLIEALVEDGFESVVVFASDYPHWDADVLNQTLARLPASWREGVLWKNAASAYGFQAG